MRIIAYETCRVTCLFPFEEVVPLGGANDREIVDGVKNRYRFLKGPELTGEAVAKNGYKFENGQFAFNAAPFTIIDFTIFRDGLVINATRTDGAEAFLEDVIAFMQREFSFRDFITKPRRIFLSQIVVEFDRPLEKLVQSVGKIASVISKPLKQIYEMEIPVKFARLDFDVDKTALPTPAPVGLQQRFILERRVGIPFEKERYFSAAPMRTDDHIKALEEIEKLVD